MLTNSAISTLKGPIDGPLSTTGPAKSLPTGDFAGMIGLTIANPVDTGTDSADFGHPGIGPTGVQQDETGKGLPHPTHLMPPRGIPLPVSIDFQPDANAPAPDSPELGPDLPPFPELSSDPSKAPKVQPGEPEELSPDLSSLPVSEEQPGISPIASDDTSPDVPTGPSPEPFARTAPETITLAKPGQHKTLGEQARSPATQANPAHTGPIDVSATKSAGERLVAPADLQEAAKVLAGTRQQAPGAQTAGDPGLRAEPSSDKLLPERPGTEPSLLKAAAHLQSNEVPSAQQSPARGVETPPQIANALEPTPVTQSRSPAPSLETLVRDPAQLETLIDNLVQARESGRASRGEMLLRHDDFGLVTMRVASTEGDLKATLNSRDPGFSMAAQTALADRAVNASSETSSSQSRSSDTHGSQTGQNGREFGPGTQGEQQQPRQTVQQQARAERDGPAQSHGPQAEDLARKQTGKTGLFA